MSKHPNPAAILDKDQYVEVQAKIRQLKARLPETSVELLAREVIRRLSEEAELASIQSPNNAQITNLCDALICEDDHAGADFIQDAQDEGATFRSLYLNYLAPAAHMLGKWWEEDRVSFVDVTLGTSRMYAIMRALRAQLPQAALISNKEAVFASVPGEEHLVGLRMAADLFRKDGWDIQLLVGRTHDELVAEITASEVVIIGLTASSDRILEALSKLVIALRINNPSVTIFVGGNIVAELHDTVSLLDVDGLAADFQTAKDFMESRVNVGRIP
jgi:methanogenic corrinoid protein MtbC1